MSKLKIIVGSTRPTRIADTIIPWISSRASDHKRFDVEVLDLNDWPLPMFAEHMGTIGDFSDPTYSDPIVKRWNKTIKDGDAFLIITPEYNHSIPAVLKNALDTVWLSFGFRNKPVTAVSYSVGPLGGVRAIEHLYHIAIEAEMIPMRNTVVLGNVGEAFDGSGEPKDPTTDNALRVALDDLSWMSLAMEKARANGEFAPGSFRLRGAAPHPEF